jgi:hypothetical protein
MSSDQGEKREMSADARTTRYMMLGWFVGIVVSPLIRDATRDSAGTWGSLLIAIIGAAVVAGVVGYGVSAMLSQNRK